MSWFADYVRHGGRVHHDEPPAAMLHRAWQRTRPSHRPHFEAAMRELAGAASKGPPPHGWFWWVRIMFEAVCLGLLGWEGVRWLLLP